eukprot:TRINITY_DN10207_c1_g1_i7.p2 TRINITY_DN10207_c1_g1~~TRINITY_DN10207_c1_g1_i7.p2  ORF type:complete len:217 (+),score=58.28 TRINITY_DN10207_c1_g1_i7:152-802(+)
MVNEDPIPPIPLEDFSQTFKQKLATETTEIKNGSSSKDCTKIKEDLILQDQDENNDNRNENADGPKVLSKSQKKRLKKKAQKNAKNEENQLVENIQAEDGGDNGDQGDPEAGGDEDGEVAQSSTQASSSSKKKKKKSTNQETLDGEQIDQDGDQMKRILIGSFIKQMDEHNNTEEQEDIPIHFYKTESIDLESLPDTNNLGDEQQEINEKQKDLDV